MVKQHNLLKMKNHNRIKNCLWIKIHKVNTIEALKVYLQVWLLKDGSFT